MIDRILFGGRKLGVLKGALAAYAERGRVHAANIANADTPGYRAQQVRFEDDLRLALRTQSSGRLERTDVRHLGPSGELPRGRVEPREAQSGALDPETHAVARHTRRAAGDKRWAHRRES